MLLPVFNGASTLARALASVRRQSNVSWECVVVDDGSTDNTPATVRRIAQVDARFRLVQTQHRGIVTALGEGLRACRGAFVARMDADDVMLPRRLRMQSDALRADSSLAAVGTHVRMFPRAGLRAGRVGYETWLNSLRSPQDVALDAFVECPIAHPTLMVRGEVLREFRYRDMGWPEDYDLILRLLDAGRRLAVVPVVLHRWRDSPGRLSRTAATYSQARFVACKAAFLAAGFLALTSRYILWGYGSTGRALGRELARHQKHPAYIVELHPGRLGQRIAGAPVIPPERLPAVGALPIVVSVAGATARGQIRAALADMGFVDGRDYRVAA